MSESFGQLFFIMKRIALHTLGCKLNFAETASIGKQFAGRGYHVVDLDEPADVVVINTCSVTERADRECRQLVRRALRHSQDAFVAVVGCYAQLQPAEIAAIPGVDLVLGTKEKLDVLRFLGEGGKRAEPEIAVSCIDQIHDATAASSAGYEGHTRAYLKVQDGCDFLCAFCTIPRARGGSRSLAADTILAGARDAAAHGYREIVLTGVNVGDYGTTETPDLLRLLQRLIDVDGVDRIRISSIEPNLLTDDLIDFWASQPRICNHWHIPLQSGSDAVLRGMRRRYRRDLYAERVAAIRSVAPNAGIGADVIVGFPGETDERFEETYEFLRDLPLSYLHVFPYSERPDTPAASFPGRVEPKIRTERSERLRALSARKRHLFAASFVGATVPVLFETDHGTGISSGLTEEYVRVRVQADSHLTNSIRRVRITDAADDTCTGNLE